MRFNLHEFTLKNCTTRILWNPHSELPESYLRNIGEGWFQLRRSFCRVREQPPQSALFSATVLLVLWQTRAGSSLWISRIQRTRCVGPLKENHSQIAWTEEIAESSSFSALLHSPRSLPTLDAWNIKHLNFIV